MPHFTQTLYYLHRNMLPEVCIDQEEDGNKENSGLNNRAKQVDTADDDAAAKIGANKKHRHENKCVTKSK